MPQGESRDSEVLDRRRRRWKSRVSKRGRRVWTGITCEWEGQIPRGPERDRYLQTERDRVLKIERDPD